MPKGNYSRPLNKKERQTNSAVRKAVPAIASEENLKRNKKKAAARQSRDWKAKTKVAK